MRLMYPRVPRQGAIKTEIRRKSDYSITWYELIEVA